MTPPPCAACGSTDAPVVIVPGTDGDRWDLFAIVRPVPDRAWCSLTCARTAGWPWMQGERSKKRNSQAGDPPATSLPTAAGRACSAAFLATDRRELAHQEINL